MYLAFNNYNYMKSFVFSKYVKDNSKSPHDTMMELFMEMLNYTNGDAGEALSWLTQLDNKHNFSTKDYGIGDFIEDLKTKGFIEENSANGTFKITGKTEQTIRKRSLDEIFGKLKKSKQGNHKTYKTGAGDEVNPETRNFQFGDGIENIAFTESMRNAQNNRGIEDGFSLQEGDLEIHEKDFKGQTSTVLMIDISHSMILYGEDRITPAKKVAMALAELIKTKYPKDTLDIIVFGNDAWQIQIKDLPYLEVGPYHTNTIAGLQLAMELLRKRKNSNKQIFMITDGKPTCMKVGAKYYKNSFGIDAKILNKTLELAMQLKKIKIPVITFMIADDPYLKQFVKEFTQTNNGKAFYSSLDGLGHYIFDDYERNKSKKLF
jgi:Ca-activated chloride channel homolog